MIGLFGLALGAEDLLRVGALGYSPKEFVKNRGILSSGSPSTRLKAGVRDMYMAGLKGTLFLTLPYAAFEGATAPKGKKVTHAAASLIANTAVPALGGVFGGPIGTLVAGSTVAPVVERGLDRTLDAFAGFNRQVTRVRMGGDFEDTQQLYTMRQRAAAELGSSLLNARQILGREAAFMHQ